MGDLGKKVTIDFSALEQEYLAKKRQENLNNIIPINNGYTESIQSDQILLNQINNLIQYFGRDQVEKMFKTALN